MADRLARRKQVRGRVRGHEETMRTYAVAVLGRHQLAGVRIVQRVVQPGDGARRVSERGMLGDVLNPFAVDPDLAAVAQALEVLLAGQREGASGVGQMPAAPRASSGFG